MSNIIKIKRGSTGGVVPSGLTFGELAVNITDRKMFVGGATGNTIELLGGGTVAFSGVTGINGLTGNVSITAGTNITLVQSGNLITLSAAAAAASAPPLASNSITGAASFNINHFVIGTTGHVSLLNTGVTGVNGLTGNISITAGTNITLVQSGNLITLSAAASVPPPLASSSITGSASFNINDFVVSTTGHVGLTGTIARTNTAQTFSGLQTFNAGITSVNLFVGGGGATFASDASFSSTTNHLGLATFVGGASASYLLVGLGGATFTSNASFNSTTNHTGLATFTGGITSSSLWIGGGGATFTTKASFIGGLSASQIDTSKISMGNPFPASPQLIALLLEGASGNNYLYGKSTTTKNSSFIIASTNSVASTVIEPTIKLQSGDGDLGQSSLIDLNASGSINLKSTINITGSGNNLVAWNGSTFLGNVEVRNRMTVGGLSATSISVSSGATFASRATFNGGLSASYLLVGGGGATFASNASFNSGLSSTNLQIGGGGATFASNASFSSTTNHTGLATFAGGITSSSLWIGGGATFSGNISASGNVVFNAVSAVFGASAANTTPITLYKDNSADNPAVDDGFGSTTFDTPNNKVPLTLSFTEVYDPNTGLTASVPGSTMIRVRNQNQNTDNFTVTDLGNIVCGSIVCSSIAPTSFGGNLNIDGGYSVTLNWDGTIPAPTVLSIYDSNTSTNALTLKGDGTFSQLTTSGLVQYGAADVLNDSYNLTTGATGATTMASFTKTQYRSFEFDIQGARGTTGPYQFTKILAVHDGTTVTTTQLSNISTGVTAGTYTVDISGTIVRLRVTPFSATSTVFKTTVKAIPV